MNSAGVVHRRGFLVLVLLGAVALTAYLVHARLGDDGGRDPAVKAAGRITVANPATSGSPNGPAYGADGGAPAANPATPGNAAPGDPAGAPKGFTTKTLTSKNVKQMGNVVVDSDGWTVYRFDEDTPRPPKSKCVDDACLAKWLPILVEGEPNVIGIDPARVGVIIRADGGRQVTLNGWALYRFVGDNGPARWKGQAVGNKWWVVQATGERNLSCLPPGAVPPAP